MHGIRASAIFKTGPLGEEQKKEIDKRRGQRQWVEYKNTDVHRFRQDGFDIVPNWRATKSIEDMKQMTLDLGSTCFMVGVWEDAGIARADVPIAPEHLMSNKNCTTWWYKPVWD